MKVAILYNTSDYLLRFRTELMQAMRSAGCEVIAITPRDLATPRLALLGVRWCEWQVQGQGINPLSDLKSMVLLRRTLALERPDAVLNFTIKPVLYGSLAARHAGVRKIVSMITGMGSVFLPGGVRKRVLLALVRQLYRFAMRSNTRVLFQNDEDLEYFVQEGFIGRDKAVRINGSGVNLELFVPRPDTILPASFVLISRMIREKGIYEFVQAARCVRREFPHAQFTLAGPIDGNPGAITRQEIASWEAEGVVHYVGIQADVRPLLASTAVYVLPTYYLEGVPRSILEALAMAKPVITTDWRGCRDTVVPGRNGWLVAPRNAPDLAEAMIRFIVAPETVEIFGKVSRQIAEEKFDVQDVNSKVLGSLGIVSRAISQGAG